MDEPKFKVGDEVFVWEYRYFDESLPMKHRWMQIRPAVVAHVVNLPNFRPCLYIVEKDGGIICYEQPCSDRYQGPRLFHEQFLFTREDAKLAVKTRYDEEFEETFGKET